MVSIVALSFLGLCLCGGVTSPSSDPPSTSPDDVILPSCLPGTRLVPARGNATEHCVECPPGQFTKAHSRAKSCLTHSECKTSERKIKDGTNTSDTVCACEDGARTYFVFEKDLRKYDCRPCKSEVATQVVNGTDEGDRVCCPPGTDAYRAPSGKVECTNTATCPNSLSAGFAVFFVFLGIFLTLAGVFLYMKRGNIKTFFKEKCGGEATNESNDGADEPLPSNTS